MLFRSLFTASRMGQQILSTPCGRPFWSDLMQSQPHGSDTQIMRRLSRMPQFTACRSTEGVRRHFRRQPHTGVPDDFASVPDSDRRSCRSPVSHRLVAMSPKETRKLARVAPLRKYVAVNCDRPGVSDVDDCWPVPRSTSDPQSGTFTNAVGWRDAGRTEYGEGGISRKRDPSRHSTSTCETFEMQRD